ncbi:mercuric reductase [Parapedobacter indicus]|uniref:Pyruvate/2-oxoglutarate dehydrogenase complex, dihydrolipoamide dehydrogenase (E3) component n=1 Tax=Parapedobacter indicus TaxID=1477437 RepID=A0A1I3VDD5_9SPHI|nr:mercuric reductase [Parapedobacter indicus]PPK98913.1 pyruvate/2-oxoglutarate dehydrogenase complex dihydrolipoamide dehydrogenase (E3) component [Parapedobacter indicus]SFJ93029.1 Pyruvate/2-oxoglutarate dehydrogenase complex, dihydrolipoamide dehydrogenase (E3) component [Parapedobacter indicus]
MEKFDAIIIGSGQAGNPLAKRLSHEGMRVAIVESAHVGGTCINYGCTPTKTLVGLAKNVTQARAASKYGIVLKNEVPDYKLISQRKDEVVGIYRKGLEKRLSEDANITVFHGTGSFSGYKEIQVKLSDLNYRSITANLIFINTGARAHIPNIEGLQSVNFLTSQSILELDYLPKELLIIGGGYVSLEFAQLFQRLGSQVTIVEQSVRLLPKEDEDVGLEITQILEAEGVNIITGATTRRVWANSMESVSVEILSEGKSQTVSGSHLLVATGRRPNTDDLNLPETGVQVDEKGFIPVNDYLETKVAGIYALGDVKGGPAFTHVSYHDYIVLTENLFDKKTSSIRNRLIPYCVFIDPELGRIGLTEKEAGEMGLDFSVAKMKTSFIARAVEVGETSGFIKAIVDNKTRKILGVAVICPNGGELMSLLQVAMMGGLTYDRLRDTMFAHPTYAEAVNNLFHPAHIKSKSEL